MENRKIVNYQYVYFIEPSSKKIEKIYLNRDIRQYIGSLSYEKTFHEYLNVYFENDEENDDFDWSFESKKNNYKKTFSGSCFLAGRMYSINDGPWEIECFPDSLSSKITELVNFN